jgi:4'-phosphopantetheinyl transferase
VPPAIEVHCIDLDGSASDADRDLATRDELERAARFRNGTDARRFLARRAAARRLIGLRLGVSPRRIAFDYGRLGKPVLIDHPLQFSLSRSGPLMMLAMADDMPVGCDIERKDPRRDLIAIAAGCFTRNEAHRIAAASGDARVAAFYDCWTRKEAYLKAIGMGMSLPMSSFEFQCDGAGGGMLDRQSTAWSSVAWDPVPEYRAAVVAAGHAWVLDRRGVRFLPRWA